MTMVLALCLAGCAGQGDVSIESTPSAAPSGPALSTGSPGLIAGETITGVLSADSVEGGCVFLAADDGTRYEVVWPDDWHITPQLDVMNPDGETVAESGDRITVRGQIADDMGSICQIGQIFEATEITLAE